VNSKKGTCIRKLTHDFKFRHFVKCNKQRMHTTGAKSHWLKEIGLLVHDIIIRHWHDLLAISMFEIYSY